jgi:predicted ATPase/class 3 adenylate cyclase
LVVEDYIETDTIAKTSYYTLHKVKCKAEGKEYLLKKFLKIGQQGIASLKSGVQLAQQLQLNSILEPIEVLEATKQVAILYNSFDGITLKKYLAQNSNLSATDFISIAQVISALVVDFHNRGWVLKNCSPDNILINLNTKECKISDLRKVTRIQKNENTDSYSDAQLAELLYISPEQTGRISQITDYRSDFYALGTIFYKMLTGQLPFKVSNSNDIIHALLTESIVSPKKVNNSIPWVLDKITMKLLAKSSNERYQSGEGLLHDLAIAENHLENGEDFIPGVKDKVTKIVPTAKLIGRKDELETIEQSYKVVKSGKKQAVYISGYSGVGKTRIVEEFYHNKIGDNIPMVASKFDILQKTTPYSALLDAITGLVSKILKKDDEELDYWKERLQYFLQENTPIMTEVIPELSALLGEQNIVDELPPDEGQKRFQQTFISFISAFTTNDHFLIVFLDDLQWADIASIRLLEMMLINDKVKNLLFIGAFRDNEVDPTHPLSISIKKLDNWINLHSINISGLDKDETKELITETLHDPIHNQNDFTEILYNKSDGNTFYTLQLLGSLFDEGILYRNEKGFWDYDEKSIVKESVSENVVDFLVKKIVNLDDEIQSLLKISACIGDVFDLKILSLLAGDKMNSVANSLTEAINMGYVISMDENVDAFFRMVSNIDENELNAFQNTSFKFAHDRIRQASLVLVDENQWANLNLKAALIKLEHLTEDQLEEETFLIAKHFNEAISLIEGKNEVNKLVDFNYRAGLKAKYASAFDSAIEYFGSAKKHISFENDYKRLYDIYLQNSECLYLIGEYDKAEKELDVLYESSKSRLDKLNTLFTKVYLYNIQDKKREALEAGRKGYKLYGIKMPVGKSAIMTLLLKDVLIARIKLPEKKIPSMIDRPLMEDEERIRFQEFLLAMSPTIYQIDQNLFAWNFMKMLMATLKYGNNGISSFSFLGYGMLISQLFGKYKASKKLADLAIDLNTKLGYTALKWKVRLTYFNFVQHWTEPVRKDMDKILEIENGAFANGDPIFAGYAIFIYLQKKFALGYRLEDVCSTFEDYLNVVDKRKDSETKHFIEGYYYAIRCLLGLEKNTLIMGEGYNASIKIEEAKDSQNFSVVADNYIAYMIVLYMFGHYKEALDNYLEASKYVDFIQQRYEFAEYNFYAILICTEAIEQNIPTSKNLKKLSKNHLKKLSTWKNICPDNFEPQYTLAKAEIAAVSKNNAKVSVLYEKAISSAEKYGFINYKALAEELAGRRQYEDGNRIMANTFLNNARKDYLQWGAVAKVEQIELQYKDILGGTILKPLETNITEEAIISSADLNFLFQANKAVKSEKDIDSLVEQLMDVIIKYSSADHGYLLVKNNAELVLKAKYDSASGATSITEFADSKLLPLNIIKYVIRTKKMLILNNPAHLPEYMGVRYFGNNDPKSMICYPVMKQDEVFGLLYLENFMHNGVFDTKKVNQLNLIASQVAVSLDSAYLYENLENIVHKRTEKIEAEKSVVNEMLENILPKAAIEELKRTGKTKAQEFAGVTVLMADIKGFTKLSERLSPAELIAKLDFYFRSFDEIMEKYQLERIKTIGDAYMAAGGLLGNAKESAQNMVNASIEMQECIDKENKKTPDEENLEMRIGLHTGPVIAGVVGIKRYQYDIWGDTVNIAARMEQQSEPGKINLSKETYELTNDLYNYNYRGKIEGKNKGLMDMYFVESKKIILL